MSLMIIAGSRSARECDVRNGISGIPWISEVTKVISGNAIGADRFGELWAAENGLEVIKFNPDWEMFGRSAGIRRNAEMAQNADSLLACFDGVSRGTDQMIKIAQRYNLKTAIYFYKENRYEFLQERKVIKQPSLFELSAALSF